MCCVVVLFSVTGSEQSLSRNARRSLLGACSGAGRALLLLALLTPRSVALSSDPVGGLLSCYCCRWSLLLWLMLALQTLR